MIGIQVNHILDSLSIEVIPFAFKSYYGTGYYIGGKDLPYLYRFRNVIRNIGTHTLYILPNLPNKQMKFTKQ